jgi:hypothetical protein
MIFPSRWMTALILALGQATAGAQVFTPSDSARSPAIADTTRFAHTRPQTSPDTVKAHPATHSPSLAMALSAILPGAGQVYNRSYWKVPVIAGLGGYFVYEFFNNNKTYKDYRERYQASLVSNPAGNRGLLNLRDFYKGQRDSFGWYFLILYVVNIADAYVDASLFEFDVSGSLAVRLVPESGTSANPGPRLGIRLLF